MLQRMDYLQTRREFHLRFVANFSHTKSHAMRPAYFFKLFTLNRLTIRKTACPPKARPNRPELAVPNRNRYLNILSL